MLHIDLLGGNSAAEQAKHPYGLIGHTTSDTSYDHSLIVDNARREGHAAGRAAARAEIMASLGQYVSDLLSRADEIGRNARQAASRTSHQRYLDRLADMKHSADDMNRKLGRPHGYSYRGGPVDWETGLPARSACAWLRNHPQNGDNR